MLRVSELDRGCLLHAAATERPPPPPPQGDGERGAAAAEEEELPPSGVRLWRDGQLSYGMATQNQLTLSWGENEY